MNLNIRELIEGRPERLRYVFRYSTTRVISPESVAEHSFFVGLYCMMIGHWVNEQSYEDENIFIDMGILLQRAIMHDLEEAVTGDFPREFKHSSETIKQSLKMASKLGLQQIIESLIGPPNKDSEKYETLENLWVNAKDDTYEGLILEFADFLAVLAFLLQEGGGGDNRIINRHVDPMDKYFEIFKDSKYDFIRPLIEQASEIMEEIF